MWLWEQLSWWERAGASTVSVSPHQIGTFHPLLCFLKFHLSSLPSSASLSFWAAAAASCAPTRPSSPPFCSGQLSRVWLCARVCVCALSVRTECCEWPLLADWRELKMIHRRWTQDAATAEHVGTQSAGKKGEFMERHLKMQKPSLCVWNNATCGAEQRSAEITLLYVTPFVEF